MLNKLELTDVGPMPKILFDFGRRLNIFTGDNGLGKSFLLDVIWYALTRKWPHDENPQLTNGYMAVPAPNAMSASISFQVDKPPSHRKRQYAVKFNFAEQAWVGKPGRPLNCGLVVYAQCDGGFCVWDPSRNYWNKKAGVDVQERESSFVFSPYEVWNGQYKFTEPSGGGTKTKCTLRGLLDDWLLWQANPNSIEFPVLVHLIEQISPPEYTIGIGEPAKISIDDVREFPTIKMPYGDTPVLWASSAIRRILCAAYILVWAFSEHVKASRLLRLSPTNHVTLLFDELDAHLHPKWQRKIMGTLVSSVEKMMQAFSRDGNQSCEVQVVASTHSPLVMASLEDVFDPVRDKWFDFDFGQNGKSVQIVNREFIRKGQSDSWLRSQAFDLSSTRSPLSEVVIQRAIEWMKSDDCFADIKSKDFNSIYEELLRRLDPQDSFLVCFRAIAEKRGLSLK